MCVYSLAGRLHHHHGDESRARRRRVESRDISDSKKGPPQKRAFFCCSLTTERQIHRAVVQRPGQQPPKLPTGVQVSPALPRRGSQVGRHLPAKQTTSVRFRAAPPQWSALVCGRALYACNCPGSGCTAGFDSLDHYQVSPPSSNGLGRHATNVEIGVQVLAGVPDLRARAANRIGHQPPKLAICGFESHRAFHAGLIQRQDAPPIRETSGFKSLARHHSGLAQQVVRSAVNRDDLRSSRRAGASFGSVAQQAERLPFKQGDAGSIPAASTAAIA